MDRNIAEEILGDIIQDDGSLLLSQSISWCLEDRDVILADGFGASELEAIVWIMRNNKRE